jgi:hypothetical protein
MLQLGLAPSSALPTWTQKTGWEYFCTFAKRLPTRFGSFTLVSKVLWPSNSWTERIATLRTTSTKWVATTVISGAWVGESVSEGVAEEALLQNDQMEEAIALKVRLLGD